MNLLRKFYALTDVELNVGSGGAKIRVDQIAGSDYEVVKQAFGIEGTATMVNSANPMPVTDNATEVSVASIDLKTPSVGQAAMVASSPVVIASNQSAVPISAAALPLPTGAATSALQTQPGVDIGDVTVNNASGASAVNIQDGGNSITVDYATTGSGTATGALRVELPSNGTGVIATVSAVTAITNALPVGANVIGKTSIDQTTPGTTNLVALAANQSVNNAQINGVTPLMGNGITGTGSQRVTIASDNTAFSVNATLAAETTKVIGTINVAAAQTIAATQVTAANLNMTEASAASILTKVTAGAASMVKLEDVASVDGDAGVPAMAIRKATPANTSGTDGDYEMLQMSGGKLWVQAGATQKPSIGATVVLAVTALQSMTSSATVGWKSVRTSNLATLANDYEVFISITTANTAPANDKAVYLFVIPWYTNDAGTTWFASSGGTATLPTSADATYTIASPHNFRLLGVLNYTTAQMVMQDTFLLSNCFGNRMPDGFSFCVINFTGATLSTSCILDISPINDILV